MVINWGTSKGDNSTRIDGEKRQQKGCINNLITLTFQNTILLIKYVLTTTICYAFMIPKKNTNNNSSFL